EPIGPNGDADAPVARGRINVGMIMMMSHLLPSLELSVLGTIKPLATKASTPLSASVVVT
ncbi:hypothetical protein, partial [Cobetia sp.]|uniref:hypothetical protein n=1 Tax=Cobetia sp. TaxID=1873876 RepID=UPI00257A6C0C